MFKINATFPSSQRRKLNKVIFSYFSYENNEQYYVLFIILINQRILLLCKRVALREIQYGMPGLQSQKLNTQFVIYKNFDFETFLPLFLFNINCFLLTSSLSLPTFMLKVIYRFYDFGYVCENLPQLARYNFAPLNFV